MCEYNFAKWDIVIIEWVNCLQLSKKIASIADLKDWDFFRNVIDLIQPELKTSVKDFLAAHYPNVLLPDSESEYDTNQLIVAASLFLHYLCLYDARDSFITPLCTQLSSNIQLHIKIFLENFSTTVNDEELVEIVKTAVLCDNNAPSTPHKAFERSLTSSCMQNSPLQEYFKTPAAKSGKMQEKDREIKRLQKELALERYEKDDLYAEVNEQKDRITKISHDVHEKSALVTILSARINELEQSSPIHHTQQVCEIETLLRKELSESQTYITTLQKECDEILTRNDEISNELTLSECTASTWQQKAVNFETQFDDISEKYKQQHEELANLRINYNELQVLLEELRESKANVNNSELETSTTATCTEPADLASTVVEIQLKECHNEIADLQRKLQSQRTYAEHVEDELQNVISELETSRASNIELDTKRQSAEAKLQEYLTTNQQLSSNISTINKTLSNSQNVNVQLEEALKQQLQQTEHLEDELNFAKVRFNELNIAHCELQERNDEIQLQIAELTESRNDLDAKNKEMLSSLENLRIASGLKDEEVNICKQQLIERNAAIAKSDEIVETLNVKLDELRSSHNELSHLLQTKNTFIQQLENESKTLQSKYENTLEKYTETNFAFEAIQVEYKRSDESLQQNINRLEQIVTGSIESAQDEKHSRFSRLLHKLGSKHKTFENTLDCNKQLSEELEKYVMKLQQCEHTNAHKVKELQSTLAETERVVQTLESEIQTKNKQIEEHRLLLSAIDETRKQFDELKVTHLGKENEIAKLTEQLNSAINELQEREKCNNELEENNCLLSKELEDLLQTRVNQNNEYSMLFQQFQLAQDEFTAKALECDGLSLNVSELQAKLENLEITHVATLADELKHVEKLNASIHELKTANRQYSADIHRISMQQNDCNNENETLRSRNAWLEFANTEVEDVAAQLRIKVAKNQTEIDDHKRSLEELMTELDFQLNKLREKDIELASTKNLISNKDIEHLRIINDLNAKIKELEESKEQIDEELHKLKESFKIKQAESEALRESKEKVEKQLMEKLEHHERKMNVLNVTMHSQEKKMKSINEAKAQIQVQLVHTAGELELIQNEKSQIIEERNALQADLAAVRKALQEKERECADHDQVVEKSNQELCALRLEMTLKLQDISILQDASNALEEEKSESVKTIKSLKHELKLLHAKYEKADADLQSVKSIKDTLTEKIEHFQSNIEAVLKHFDVKQLSLKESCDDLMSFKTRKDAEVSELNEEINELREELARAKNEEVSTKKALSVQIAQQEKVLQSLEAERDDLKLVEANCLQEIERLKDELSYTVEKYTKALQVEKEVKSENEAQIQTLTESVYDILEKFNQLDKEHKQALHELAYNVNAVSHLKSEKECLELEIVQLKSDFDRDTANCKDEYAIELAALRQTEGNLHEEIEHLKSALIASKQKDLQLENELCDANTQLNVINDEQDELKKKLQSLESTYSGLQHDYNSLEIANEAYMKESKAGLIQTQDALQAEIQSLKAIVDAKDAENKETHKKIRELTNRLNKEEETFRSDTDARQKQIKSLQVEIAGYKRNIETLNNEKESVTQKLHTQQANFKESNGKVSELEAKVRTLEMSKDVLEAGRQKLERLHESMQQRAANWECKHKEAEKDHEAIKNVLIAQLQQAKETIEHNNAVIKEKSMQIVSTNEEFDTVQMILTEMSKKMDSSSRELSVIHENYEGKLKAELDAFSKLRDQFHATSKELRYMTMLNEELRLELDKLKQERDAVDDLIDGKEKLIAEMRAKYDTVAVLVDAKDARIASLQAELAARLEQLESAAEQKQRVQDEHRCAAIRLELLTHEREELIRTHHVRQRENEENFLFLHKQIEALITKLRGEEKCEQQTIENIRKLLDSENSAKQHFETHIEELRALVHDANTVKKKLTTNLRRLGALLQEKDDIDEVELDAMILDTEQRIVNIFTKLRQLETACETATQDKNKAESTLLVLTQYNHELCEEKTQLMQSYETLKSEKEMLSQEKHQASKNVMQIENLYEQQQLLEQTIADLQEGNKLKHNNYATFIQRTKCVFKEIDLMTKERNQIDQIVCNLQEHFVTLQIKSAFITEDRHKLFYEQKTAVEIIADDIYKQFRRVSKMIYNLNLKCHAEMEHSINGVVNDAFVNWQTIYEDLNGDEILEKLDDLKENSSNALEQVKTFLATIDSLPCKDEVSKVLKENVQQSLKGRDDDWKKKYFSVKQKLTLTENAKNIFERKLRELREEKKKMGSEDVKPNIADLKMKNGNIDLFKKLQDHAIPDCKALVAAQLEIDELKKQITAARLSHNELKQENVDLHKAVKEKVEASKSLSQLLEDNSKLQSEIDTLKYKRTRDREEFVKQIKHNEAELNQKMQTIKSEYDMKVEKFKSKIMSKYKEQVESNNLEKFVVAKEENDHYKTMITKLRDELAVAQAKVEILDSEKHLALQQLRLKDYDFKAPAKQLIRAASSQSLENDNVITTEQRRATLTTLRRNTQSMNIIEEVRYRRTSIGPANDLQMEDEDEMFNTKYLQELKSGGRQNAETSNSRLSEFAYRNSLCPPHLKSSYPAETQFIDSRRFKDDDLKCGHIDLNDSMKTHLLPQEKSKKKDVGTTSYKRPGPPTPSKHGARLSLQGIERNTRDVPNEQKKTTPNPLRSLFSRSKDVSSENAASPKKRTMFFRR